MGCSKLRGASGLENVGDEDGRRERAMPIRMPMAPSRGQWLYISKLYFTQLQFAGPTCRR